MQIHFFKYQGTGNDFVILDNRKNELSFTREQISFLCHRRFGIGADGLMLLNTLTGYDFEMKYYNADGGESTMCGNGGRCLTRFAFDQGIVKQDYLFLAIDGEHEARIETDGTVALKMKNVQEVRYEGGDYVLNTGSPHYVQLVNDVNPVNVLEQGRQIRYNDTYKKEGINVNFVQKTNQRDTIVVRTYERGVEDETFSCGTGVTAAALVCFHNENGYNRVNVDTKGGKLSVEYEKMGNQYQNVWLIGPAVKVFEGSIHLD